MTRLVGRQHGEIYSLGERAILTAPRGQERSRQGMRRKPAAQCLAVQPVRHIIHHPEAVLAFARDFAGQRSLDLFRRHPVCVDAQPLRHLAHLVGTQRLSLLRPQGSLGVIVAVGAHPEDAAGIRRAKVQRVLFRQQ